MLPFLVGFEFKIINEWQKHSRFILTKNMLWNIKYEEWRFMEFLSEIAATCDRIIVISKGNLVADAKTSELSSVLSGDQKLNLEIEGPQSTVLNALKVISGVLKVRKLRDVSMGIGKYVVEYKNGVDIRKDVFKAIARTECCILDMQNGNETLEDSFLKLTSYDQTENYKGGKV